MENNPTTVSVIVPVHNVGDYLADCVNSIKCQTLKNIEIILVDDASQDNCQEIINRFASTDSRIIPLNLPQNVGQGFARNAGLNIATGKYVFFVDGDDILSNPNAIEHAVNAAEANNADLVRLRKLIFNDGEKYGEAVLANTEFFFPNLNVYEDICSKPKLFTQWNVWNVLYKRSLIEKHSIQFVTPQWEERLFICKALKYANRLVTLPEYGIAYRRRKNSTVRRSRSCEDLQHMITNISSVRRLFQDNDLMLQFTGLQFAAAMSSGYWGQLLYKLSGTGSSRDVLNLLSSEFNKYNLNIEEIDPRFYALLTTDRPYEAILLFIYAVKNKRWDLFKYAIQQQKIEQEELFSLLLERPLTKEENEYHFAISYYARNNNIKKQNTRQQTSSPPKIIIHLGSTKTGSTYIQNFFEKNRAAALRKGIWYPEVGLFWQNLRPHKQAGHAGFLDAARNKDPYLIDYLKSGIKYANGHIHTILLSSEAFFLSKDSLSLTDYLSYFPTDIIIYLRSQSDWANSQYCEFVSGGSVSPVSSSISDWISQPSTQNRLSYKTILDTWAAKIGHDHIVVRHYDKKNLINGDILEDFCRAIGAPYLLDLPRPSETMANKEVFEKHQIELMRLFNGFQFSDRSHYLRFIERVTWEFHETSKLNNAPIMIDEETRTKLYEKFAGENAEIANSYGINLNISLSAGIRPKEENLLEFKNDFQKLCELYFLCSGMNDTQSKLPLVNLRNRIAKIIRMNKSYLGNLIRFFLSSSR